MVHVRHVICLQHSWETAVKLANCNVTSGLRRPLAAEIDKAPLLTAGKRI
jgi:hypothetical protein